MTLKIAPEAYALAEEIARLSGESLSQAIETALREKLARLKADALAEELMLIGMDCANRLKGPWRTVDHGALLHNEMGLPR